MNVKVFGILALLVFLCVFMAVMTAEPWYDVTDSTFLQPNNIENLLRRTALYGILGIGVAFVIVSSGIDLSIGSVVCLSGCLLALFLHVDYRAFDHATVERVLARDKLIVLRGEVRSFQARDRVRFSGGRRARNALLDVRGVEVKPLPVRDGEVVLQGAGGGASRLFTLLHVEQELSNDDVYGQIAKVYPVEQFSTGEEGATVTLAGDHARLADRDQLVLVHQDAGMKQLVVRAAEPQGASTRVQLDEGLGTNFSREWLAIPLERRQRMPVPLALAAVLGIAVALGLIHGLLVTRVKLQPFVVTLCGLLIYRGISRWLVNDQPVGFGNEYEHSLSLLGAGKAVVWEWESGGQLQSFGIPLPFFVLVMAAVVAAVYLNKTIWGRYLLALGRNEEAALYSGINTRRITVVAYVISTSMAAVGGILFALDANSISPSSFGNFFELYAIAAAVLGGCSLRGGEGSIAGVIIGTAVMQVLYNLIVLMHISGTLEFAIIGTVILFGVVMDELVRRIAARRRAVAQARGA